MAHKKNQNMPLFSGGKYMKSKLFIFGVLVLILSGCFYNSYYFSRYSKVYDDSFCEINILYDCLSKNILRVYFIPKNSDSCDEYLVGMNANLKINLISLRDTTIFLNFKSKTDTSTYDLSSGSNNLIFKNNNGKFATYSSSECCGCKSWFSHCMVNLYATDTNNLSKLILSQYDPIWYDISGKLFSHGKLIEINSKGIMDEGKVSGKTKPRGFDSR